MTYKLSSRHIAVNLLLLTGISVLAGFAAAMCWWWLVLCLVVFIVAVSWKLVKYVATGYHQITFFIRAIKNEDTSLRFPDGTGSRNMDELHKSLNELNEMLRDVKQKSRIQARFFSEILQNIASGVMVYNQNGFVSATNSAMRKMLQIKVLTHINQLERVDPEFRRQLDMLEGGQKKVLQIVVRDEPVQVVVRCTQIQLKDELVKLITIQDIQGEMERKELDSWIKLIRVMSHEIMNSLTPVTSITQTLQQMWKRNDFNTTWPNPELVDSTIKGLDVIGERATGLIRFVESYRMLARVPDVHPENISVIALFERLSILTSPYKEASETALVFRYPVSPFEIRADEQLLVQMVLNLVKNAFEALVNMVDGTITVDCHPLHNAHFVLTVSDNGPGISPEIASEIFIPFFTTKANGNGVGLSYSRQLAGAHGGTLKCTSVPGHTVFKIEI